jgi:hypothetical protein
VIDNISSVGSTYPMAALDEARGGYWILSANGTGELVLVKFSDWSKTPYPVSYNEYGDNSLIYVPAPYDCLVGMGRGDSGNTVFNVRVCPIVGGVPTAWTKVTPTGTPPADGRAGGQWFKSLGKIVSYVGNGSYVVHHLTLPSPGSLTTGSWAWTSETLVGANGATPSKNPVNTNGSWGRFLEVEAAGCAIFCDGIDQPTQAWRLTGM